MLNHLPLAATIVGTCVLLAGVFLKNSFIQRTALGIFIASAIVAIPVYLTGEGAEDVAKNLPGVTENFIEEHEDIANLFFISVIVLGLASIGTFFLDILRSKYIKLIYNLILLIAITTCVIAKQTGTTGGEIRHTEIRSNATADLQPGNTENQHHESNKQTDDD